MTEINYPPISIEQTPEHLKLERKPDGPVVVINTDGTIVVNRGQYDEAAKLFWDAVRVQGATYRQQIQDLQLTILNLGNDPYRKAIHQGYRVYKELPKYVQKTLTYHDVSAVLAAVEQIAQKEIQ